MHLRPIIPVCVLFIFSGQAARADILTSSSQLSPTNTTLDFESFPAGLTSNPLVIGDASFSSVTPLAIIDISSFGAHGSTVFRNVLRPNGANPLGVSGYTDIRIDFASPIGEIGLGWFDPNFVGNSLDVYDSSNTLLESAPIPTGPIGGSSAAFRGIRRSTNDIAYAITRVSSPDDVYGIDNVSFGTVSAAVPEPSSVVLFACGLSAAGVVNLRSRRARQRAGFCW